MKKAYLIYAPKETVDDKVIGVASTKSKAEQVISNLKKNYNNWSDNPNNDPYYFKPIALDNADNMADNINGDLVY